MAVKFKSELVLADRGRFNATAKRQPIGNFGRGGLVGAGEAFAAAIEDDKAIMAAAVTAGVREATLGFQADLRRLIEQAGLGERFPKAVRAVVYPERKASLSAVGWVYAKGKRTVDILQAYATGATVRARGGKYLAIPTPAAGKSGGRFARITPKAWEYLRGARLRLVVPRRRKNILLLVADLRRSRGKRGGFRVPSAAARARRDFESVVVFILVRQVTIAKRFTTDGLAQKWVDAVPSLIEQELPGD